MFHSFIHLEKKVIKQLYQQSLFKSKKFYCFNGFLTYPLNQKKIASLRNIVLLFKEVDECAWHVGDFGSYRYLNLWDMNLGIEESKQKKAEIKTQKLKKIESNHKFSCLTMHANPAKFPEWIELNRTICN